MIIWREKMRRSRFPSLPSDVTSCSFQTNKLLLQQTVVFGQEKLLLLRAMVSGSIACDAKGLVFIIEIRRFICIKVGYGGWKNAAYTKVLDACVQSNR